MTVEIEILMRLFAEAVQELMEVVPQGSEDESLFSELVRSRSESDSDILETAKRLRKKLPSSAMLSFAGTLLFHWEDYGAAAAHRLKAIDMHDVDEDPNQILVSSFCTAVAFLGNLAQGKEDPADYPKLVDAFSTLATFMEARHKPDVAYDFISMSLPYIADDDPALTRMSKQGLRLSLLGGKPDQICIMSIKVAVAAVAKATNDSPSRLDAYAACEVAIERIALARPGYRNSLAELLRPTIDLNEWLEHLRIRMMPYLVNEAGKVEVRRILDGHDWPQRVASVKLADWADRSAPILHLMRGEIHFENERLRLLNNIRQAQIVTDPVDWTFKMAAYANAVPHSGSLLKEREFPERLVVLIHELTHVFTFLGGLGAALLALRVASFWHSTDFSNSPPEALAKQADQVFLSQLTSPTLADNDIMLLLPVERQLEARLKAQILLDVWTPWIEGLAVFGELGADPKLDDIGINPVIECLRNLVDFFADPGTPGSPSEEILDHYEGFEEQCSAALAKISPLRLGDYLRRGEDCYFHGYLTLRAIASRWRLKTSKHLTSVQCFDIFLHATRHIIREFIPDLGLASSDFEKAARAGVFSFAKMLSGLTREDLEIYSFRAGPSAKGLPVIWRNGRIQFVEEMEEAALIDGARDISRNMIEQALRCMTANADISRAQHFETETLALIFKITQLSRESLDEILSREGVLDELQLLFEGLFELGSILPIGKCSSAFYLQVDDEADVAQMYASIRTAEALVDTGRPSYSGFWFPQTGAMASAIRESYKRNAVPRIDITRVIVLSELSVRGLKIRFPNFFAFKYPEWFDICGTSQWAQRIEDLDKTVWEGYRELIKRRLDTEGLLLIEREFVTGEKFLQEVNCWLKRSSDWRLGNVRVRAGDWARHIQCLADRLSDDAARKSVRQSSTDGLFGAVYGANERAKRAASATFRQMLGTRPGDSDQVIGALFESARQPCESTFLDHCGDRFGVAGLPIFKKTSLGWDVTPAIEE